jgi:hypothetical protein
LIAPNAKSLAFESQTKFCQISLKLFLPFPAFLRGGNNACGFAVRMIGKSAKRGMFSI